MHEIVNNTENVTLNDQRTRNLVHKSDGGLKYPFVSPRERNDRRIDHERFFLFFFFFFFLFFFFVSFFSWDKEFRCFREKRFMEILDRHPRARSTSGIVQDTFPNLA